MPSVAALRVAKKTAAIWRGSAPESEALVPATSARWSGAQNHLQPAMKLSLLPPEAPDRRCSGWTAFASLPAALAILMSVPLLELAPAVGGPMWDEFDAALSWSADSARSVASQIVDAMTDPETLVRGVTGKSGASMGLE